MNVIKYWELNTTPSAYTIYDMTECPNEVHNLVVAPLFGTFWEVWEELEMDGET